MSRSPSSELESLLSHIESGATLALPADYGGSPAEAVRQLVRRGVSDLRIVGGPPSGYVTDLLVGAGRVASLEMPGVILGDFGLAQRFRRAVARGTIDVKDTTCPAFHASIAAARQGLPFMPIRGLIGSDVLANRPDWTIIDNPFGQGEGGDPIVLIPAFSPDVALFHARLADAEGNVWLGKNFEVRGIAQAAKKVLVTYENLYDGNLLDDLEMAPATLSHIYITATAHVPGGTWPLPMRPERTFDSEHMQRYAELSRSDEGFQQYLDEFVLDGLEVKA